MYYSSFGKVGLESKVAIETLIKFLEWLAYSESEESP